MQKVLNSLVVSTLIVIGAVTAALFFLAYNGLEWKFILVVACQSLVLYAMVKYGTNLLLGYREMKLTEKVVNNVIAKDGQFITDSIIQTVSERIQVGPRGSFDGNKRATIFEASGRSDN